MSLVLRPRWGWGDTPCWLTKHTAPRTELEPGSLFPFPASLSNPWPSPMAKFSLSGSHPPNWHILCPPPIPSGSFLTADKCLF